MIIARVTGIAVSTLKDPRLEGQKLLVVSRANTSGEATAEPFVAADLVGAGEGELVFVVQGRTASRAMGSNDAPVDAAIVGILNSLSSGGRDTFTK